MDEKTNCRIFLRRIMILMACMLTAFIALSLSAFFSLNRSIPVLASVIPEDDTPGKVVTSDGSNEGDPSDDSSGEYSNEGDPSDDDSGEYSHVGVPSVDSSGEYSHEGVPSVDSSGEYSNEGDPPDDDSGENSNEGDPSDDDSGEYDEYEKDGNEDEGIEEGENENWPEDGIAARIPMPEFDMDSLLININMENDFMATLEASKADYETYVLSCADHGFTLEEETHVSYEYSFPVTGFSAFDSDGYKVSVEYWDYSEDPDFSTLKNRMEIRIKAAITLGPLYWPDHALGLIIPHPPTEAGSAGGAPEIFLRATLGNMPLETYQEYIEACREAGFDRNVSETDREYFATDEYGIQLTLSYYGGGIVDLRLFDPAQKWRSRLPGDSPAGGGEGEDGSGIPGEPDAPLPDSIGTEDPDGNTENPEESSDGNIEIPEDSSDGNIEIPEDGSDGYIENPEESSDGNIENPEDGSDGNIENPEESSDGNIGNSEESSDGNFENPEDGSDGNFENPEDSSDGNIGNPEEDPEEETDDPAENPEERREDPQENPDGQRSEIPGGTDHPGDPYGGSTGLQPDGDNRWQPDGISGELSGEEIREPFEPGTDGSDDVFSEGSGFDGHEETGDRNTDSGSPERSSSDDPYFTQSKPDTGTQNPAPDVLSSVKNENDPSPDPAGGKKLAVNEAGTGRAYRENYPRAFPQNTDSLIPAKGTAYVLSGPAARKLDAALMDGRYSTLLNGAGITTRTGQNRDETMGAANAQTSDRDTGNKSSSGHGMPLPGEETRTAAALAGILAALSVLAGAVVKRRMFIRSLY